MASQPLRFLATEGRLDTSHLKATACDEEDEQLVYQDPKWLPRKP